MADEDEKRVNPDKQRDQLSDRSNDSFLDKIPGIGSLRRRQRNKHGYGPEAQQAMVAQFDDFLSQRREPPSADMLAFRDQLSSGQLPRDRVKHIQQILADHERLKRMDNPSQGDDREANRYRTFRYQMEKLGLPTGNDTASVQAREEFMLNLWRAPELGALDQDGSLTNRIRSAIAFVNQESPLWESHLEAIQKVRQAIEARGSMPSQEVSTDTDEDDLTTSAAQPAGESGPSVDERTQLADQIDSLTMFDQWEFDDIAQEMGLSQWDAPGQIRSGELTPEQFQRLHDFVQSRVRVETPQVAVQSPANAGGEAGPALPLEQRSEDLARSLTAITGVPVPTENAQRGIEHVAQNPADLALLERCLADQSFGASPEGRQALSRIFGLEMPPAQPATLSIEEDDKPLRLLEGQLTLTGIHQALYDIFYNFTPSECEIFEKRVAQAGIVPQHGQEAGPLGYELTQESYSFEDCQRMLEIARSPIPPEFVDALDPADNAQREREGRARAQIELLGIDPALRGDALEHALEAVVGLEVSSYTQDEIQGLLVLTAGNLSAGIPMHAEDLDFLQRAIAARRAASAAEPGIPPAADPTEPLVVAAGAGGGEPGNPGPPAPPAGEQPPRDEPPRYEAHELVKEVYERIEALMARGLNTQLEEHLRAAGFNPSEVARAITNYEVTPAMFNAILAAVQQTETNNPVNAGAAPPEPAPVNPVRVGQTEPPATLAAAGAGGGGIRPPGGPPLAPVGSEPPDEDGSSDDEPADVEPGNVQSEEVKAEELRERADEAWQEINTAIVYGERDKINRILSPAQRQTLARLLENDAKMVDFTNEDRVEIIALNNRIQTPPRPDDYIPANAVDDDQSEGENDTTEPEHEPTAPAGDQGETTEGPQAEPEQPANRPSAPRNDAKITVENWQPGTIIDEAEGLAYVRRFFGGRFPKDNAFLRRLDPALRVHWDSIVYSANRGDALTNAQRRHLTDVITVIRNTSRATSGRAPNAEQQPSQDKAPAMGTADQSRRSVEQRPTNESFGGRLAHTIRELNRTNREEFTERLNDLSLDERQELGRILENPNSIDRAQMLNDLDDPAKDALWQAIMAPRRNNSERKWFRRRGIQQEQQSEPQPAQSDPTEQPRPTVEPQPDIAPVDREPPKRKWSSFFRRKKPQP